jgi:hypothetical protein
MYTILAIVVLKTIVPLYPSRGDLSAKRRINNKHPRRGYEKIGILVKFESLWKRRIRTL